MDVTIRTNDATDNELMQHMAAGDESALAALYDRYCRLVMSVALAVVGDQATAEEVTLDVFLRAWQHAAGYDPSLAKVSTWLTRLARNRGIDRLRRDAVRPAGHSVALGDVPAEGAVDVEAAIDRALQRRRVRAAVASLPIEQRQALSLAFFQGYTHSEIAGLLKESLGTVKGQIRGGMVRLRVLLAAEVAAPPPREPEPARESHDHRRT